MVTLKIPTIRQPADDAWGQVFVLVSGERDTNFVASSLTVPRTTPDALTNAIATHLDLLMSGTTAHARCQGEPLVIEIDDDSPIQDIELDLFYS